MFVSSTRPKIRNKNYDSFWSESSLIKLGNTYSGLSGKSKKDFGHGAGSYVTYLNIFNNTVALESGRQAIEVDDSQNRVEYGDAFFTISSETPNEVAMSSVWLSNIKNVYLNSFSFGWRPTSKNINVLFLAYLLRSPFFRKKVLPLAQGISRYNVSKRSVVNLPIYFPSRSEQLRIANLLEKVDFIITQTERTVQHYKKVKKLFLQNLFKQKWRFKGFTAPWEQRKLSDVAKRVVRKNSKLQTLRPLTISAELGLVDQKVYFNKIVASSNLRHYILLLRGEFAYNKSYSKGYPFGTIKRLDKYGKGAISTLYIAFKCISADSAFLEQYYESSNWYAEVSKVAAEGARNHGLLNISPIDFMSMHIIIPTNLSEQTQVGGALSKLDNLIVANEKKVDQLKQLKKFFMQNMFV